jgi:hypothetical protein
MDLASEVNGAALRLWRKHFRATDDVLCPLVYPAVKTGCLLFVGMNPSSSKKVSALVRTSPFPTCDYYDFFHFKNSEKLELPKAQQIEEWIKDRFPFFTRFKEISEETKLDWEHVDLFFFRQTKQHEFKSRIFEDVGTLSLNEFGRDQLKLSSWLIRQLKPRLIVVANALASRIFLQEFSTRFDEEFGFYQTKLGDTEVPTFFSAMLTGRQPLDEFSFERLKWHIRFATKVSPVATKQARAGAR